MAGRRAIKAINWAALAERVPEAEKTSLATFKAKSDQYLRRVQENPESPPKLDWALYKKKISVPGLVDTFQKEYESLKVPYPEDKYTPVIETQEKEAQAQVKQFIDASNKRIEDYQKEIERLKGLLSYGAMTMEDFRDAHPDIALDPVNRPTLYPHTPELQPGYQEDKKATSH